MKTKTYSGAIILVIMVIIAVVAIVRMQTQKATQGSQPIATISYACKDSKAIVAAYYQGESRPAQSPDKPPIPGGSVNLALSDGRTMILAQTISADGTRYANPDESFVFWSKGNGALVLEDNKEKSFIGCIQVAVDPGGLSQVYASGSEGFSIRYPADYPAGEAYTYQNLGPGRDINGTKFTIAPSIAQDTNLGEDSYVSVEEIPQVKNCTADLFLDQSAKAHVVTLGDVEYSIASSTGAGAGNRYDETVYALPGTNPCIAVRYFIHYSVFENYPAGTVRRFDESALRNQFDMIRRTLTIVQ